MSEDLRLLIVLKELEEPTIEFTGPWNPRLLDRILNRVKRELPKHKRTLIKEHEAATLAEIKTNDKEEKTAKGRK